MNIKAILNDKKLVVSIVVLLILLIVAVVVAVCHNDSDNSEAYIENTTIPISQQYDNILSGDSTFLVAVINDSNDIVLHFLADFKIYSQNLVLTPLQVDTVSADGRTYGECYAYGGINLLKSTIEEARNIAIDRFVVINKSGFSKLTELMGEVTLFAEEDFTYDSSDKTYSVSKGENEMGSDMLYTYIALLASHNFGEQKSTDIICTIINSYIENIDYSDYEKMFGEITNCFFTDLTITDFYTAENDIEYLISNGFTCILSDNVDE